jgi:hypothetical protein
MQVVGAEVLIILDLMVEQVELVEVVLVHLMEHLMDLQEQQILEVVAEVLVEDLDLMQLLVDLAVVE